MQILLFFHSFSHGPTLLKIYQKYVTQRPRHGRHEVEKRRAEKNAGLALLWDVFCVKIRSLRGSISSFDLPFIFQYFFLWPLFYWSGRVFALFSALQIAAKNRGNSRYWGDCLWPWDNNPKSCFVALYLVFSSPTQ